MVETVRKLGLKMGVWHIRGAHREAVERKLPVKGTEYTIDQIVNQCPDNSKASIDCTEACNWCEFAINLSDVLELRD